MKKIIVAATLCFSSFTLFAHNQICEYSLDYDINISESKISFTNDSLKDIIFHKDRLVIGGKQASLNRKQLKNSLKFQRKTRELVPKIAEIALEGAGIGVKAATLAVTALFGNDLEIKEDLLQPIESISNKIKANINDKMINVNTIETSLDTELEKEIENLVAKALSKYSGKVIGQILSTLFSGDEEEIKDFEFRMENLEHDIETYVESQADELEDKAEELCQQIELLSEIDQKLIGVEGYPKSGIILANASFDAE
ncbi:MAG: YggN family protein [Kangiellaceae bacterium]|nr:YggN family protein [Kangiellaceae bacterium]